MIFVDTNYFLRFLLEDVNEQYEEAKILFKKGALSEVKLFTSIIVVFEVYWVLSSFYGKKKDELRGILSDLLGMRFIEYENFEYLSEAVRFMPKANDDLEDAYNLVYAKDKQAMEFMTFDVKLRKGFRVVK